MKPVTSTSPETTAPVLPATLELSSVRLAVTDLERSVPFYEAALGMRVHERDATTARLGADTVVLELVEERGAGRPGRQAGLFHVAFNYPTRAELAATLDRIASGGVPIEGASDHQSHEALYLADPDGNGLELAWDFPQEQWPSYSDMYAEGVRPHPLDLQGLLASAPGTVEQYAAPGLRVGHVHLHVGSVERALDFYVNTLGFELKGDLGSAAFVSAGGYHHHVGLNVWKGEGVPPQTDDVVGVRAWEFTLPSVAEMDAVRERLEAAGHATIPIDGGIGFSSRDPWSIPFMVRAAS